VIKILFVDDDVRILDGLQRMLRPQRDKWEMVFVPGGVPALATLEKTLFDVVVSDMRMPGIDGVALLEVVKKKYPSALRIILSGYTQMEASFRVVPVAHQFLLKPCDGQTLRNAIERATSLQSVLNDKRLTSIVGSLQELPSTPQIYAELRAAISDPDTSIERIAKIVEKDVAMCAKVLQMVNSAFFGMMRDITEIRTAVTCLGMNILHNLVLSVEVLRTFRSAQSVPSFSIEAFQSHCQSAAKIAGQWGGQGSASRSAVVAAFLHDVGKLVLAERAPEQFGKALTRASAEKRPLFEVEEEVMGVSHAEVGAYLLSLWGVPYPIVEAVAYHHHPTRLPQEKLDLTTVTYVANLLAHQCSEEAASGLAFVYPEIDEALLAAIGEAAHLAEWRKMAASAAGPAG
jgi:putative nucleotidyltransferase with HDIG domain